MFFKNYTNWNPYIDNSWECNPPLNGQVLSKEGGEMISHLKLHNGDQYSLNISCLQ
jgi:hypothetical protein